MFRRKRHEVRGKECGMRFSIVKILIDLIKIVYIGTLYAMIQVFQRSK